ncbi:glycerophosphodiester phosphodiesterase family protein [Henriciella sp.]|uniref:glycerophosphodiester phosphodiesterase family protein n=1 Tax=Henriciella sp. TaxID=1968823 RepID=UPI00262E86B6|nr:glycerophosphodiester phosphodiesterase family protein [Henriciella sp.]
MKKLIVIASLAMMACAAPTPTDSQIAGPSSTETKTMGFSTLTGEPPIIIAHRGASGLYPEHTAKAYLAAMEQGADFIEPDLAMTKDGILIASHDAYLSDTTNVADHPEFADRKVTRKTPLGEREDWWTDDFTLAEIKTLKARQRVAGRSQEYNDLYDILTFNEVLDLVIAQDAVGRTVGLHIEAKWPSYFSSVGLDMVDPILEALDRKGIRGAGIPVYIQCFEPQFLEQMAEKSDLPLIQNLVGPPYAALLGMDLKLEDIHTTGVGANKTLILSEDGSVTDYVDRAHEQGLLVHVYTVRDDAPAPGFDSADAELKALFGAGVDGVWTDYPATALKVRDGE